MQKKLRYGVLTPIAILLTAVILISLTACGAGTKAEEEATESEATAENTQVYQGTFSFEEIEDSFFYEDAYFTEPGNSQNEHLRTLSAVMSLAADGSDAEDAIDVMTQIGIDRQSIQVDDMVQGTTDTIGSVIGHKEFGDGALVAVAIRGKGYEGEWAANMLAGTEGDATGMDTAAQKLAERLKRYLTENAIAKAKIWVSGYSRAGSAANLLGRYLNEDPDLYKTTADDIYVYTFEAARCSADNTVYPNIHNVTDINDAVVYMFPEGWGLYLNGVTEKMGDPAETIRTKYFSPSAEGYLVDYQERQTSVFMEQFEEFVGTGSTRSLYATSVEPYLSALCSLYFGKSGVDREALSSYLKKTGEHILNDPAFGLVSLEVMLDPTAEKTINDVCEVVYAALDAEREAENPPLSDAEYEQVHDSVYPIVTFVMTLADSDVDYAETDENGKTVNLNLFHIVTFAANTEQLLAPHISDYVFKQVKRMDSYYTAEEEMTEAVIDAGESDEDSDTAAAQEEEQSSSGSDEEGKDDLSTLPAVIRLKRLRILPEYFKAYLNNNI